MILTGQWNIIHIKCFAILLKVYYYKKHVGLQFVLYLFERLDLRLFHLTSVILFFVYKISWIGEQSEQSDWLLMAAISNYLWANWIHSCLRQFLCFTMTSSQSALEFDLCVPPIFPNFLSRALFTQGFTLNDVVYGCPLI